MCVCKGPSTSSSIQSTQFRWIFLWLNFVTIRVRLLCRQQHDLLYIIYTHKMTVDKSIIFRRTFANMYIYIQIYRSCHRHSVSLSKFAQFIPSRRIATVTAMILLLFVHIFYDIFTMPSRRFILYIIHPYIFYVVLLLYYGFVVYTRQPHRSVPYLIWVNASIIN